MNQIKTISISELIRNNETPNRKERFEHYLIPAYQRGYRWTELHVKALLEDIDDFINKQKIGTTKENYCLQPVVVAQQFDENGDRIWEVIDGQQRLTTLWLILKKLGRPKYKLHFEKRKQSASFLENLTTDTFDDSYPDYHFMSTAYRFIDDWFNKKEINDISYADDFATTLLKQVQVIWYDVQLKELDPQRQESEKIDIFNRLNIGKIPLEDAELVRALIMSKIDDESSHEKLMRQSEISNEWYEIEYWLKRPEVWNFYTNKTLANHIQIIFELLSKNKNSVNYSTYKWFENEIRNSADQSEKAKELWIEVKQLFGKLRYWYNNRTLYHYIGFLLASNQCKLDELVNEQTTDKEHFKNIVVAKVKSFLNSVDMDALSYEKDQQCLKNVLLLFNVLSIEQVKSNGQSRFPFNRYNEIKKDEKWSLEHIHAQKSQEEMKRDDVIRRWISETIQSVGNIDVIDKVINPDTNETISIDITEIKGKLKELSKAKVIDTELFNSLRERFIDAFESPSTKHLLDNMALLSCPDNSSLNNSIFPVKRDRIIEMDRDGSFIPQCTKNVFLKLYSPADGQPYYWGYSDKVNYIKEINRVFDEFQKEK